MSDINLEYVNPHDADECAAGMDRLRGERDEFRRQLESARLWAIEYERENLALRAENVSLANRLQLHESRQERIEMPLTRETPINGQEEIGGVGV